MKRCGGGGGGVCVCGGGGGGGGWPLHILPKTHDWHVCPISVF